MRAAFNALPFPTDSQLLWLLDQEIDAEAMGNPWPIRIANVEWLDNAFDFSDEGDPTIIFRAEDHGDVTDLCGWSPRSHKLASWQGSAFCIGDLDQAFNPATYYADGALRIHRSPLEWLVANREGIVIVREELTYANLRHCPRLAFSDAVHAKRVRRWMEPPKPQASFLVEAQAARAAA